VQFINDNSSMWVINTRFTNQLGAGGGLEDSTVPLKLLVSFE